MRAVELAKVAAAAETLRLRRLARRQAIRVAYAVVAAVFAIAAFVMLHVLAYVALCAAVRPWVAALILLAVDGVIAGVVGSIALRNQPDSVEREAVTVRRQALSEMKRAVTVMSVASELTGLVIRRRAARSVVGSSRSKAWLAADIASRLVRRRR